MEDQLKQRLQFLVQDDPDLACVLLFASLIKSPKLADLAIKLAHQGNLDPTSVCECILQSFLFAGFPRCINGLESFRRHYGDQAGKNEPRKTMPDDIQIRRSAGEALFRRIYAENSDRVLKALDDYDQDLRDWILVDAYGKILARPELSPRIRELCATVGLLVSGDLRQLSSHMRGAIHCGSSILELRGAIKATDFLLPQDHLELGEHILDKIAASLAQ